MYFGESPRLPFVDTCISGVPEGKGIYRLYSRMGLIYIGKASDGDSTIRSRLQRHLRGDEGYCTQKATEFTYEVRPDADAYEQMLLQIHELVNGKPPLCNKVVPRNALAAGILSKM